MATATPEAVAAAAEALQAAGKRVSTIAVQGHLGGGSFTTVQKYLEGWQQTQRDQRAAVVDVPSAVVERGMTLLRQVWQAAQAEAGQEITQTREETEAQLAEMRDQLAEALLAVQRQEAENAEQAEALATLEKQVSTLQAERDEARTEARVNAAQVAAAAERVQELQTRLDAQASVSLELAQLQGAHGALQRQVEEQAATIKSLASGRGRTGKVADPS
jgi:predicted RNase H-like nuclease (RuvC/YqgF family)